MNKGLWTKNLEIMTKFYLRNKVSNLEDLNANNNRKFQNHCRTSAPGSMGIDKTMSILDVKRPKDFKPSLLNTNY